MEADHANPNTILGAIFQERALEFAGEFLRKQDLIRWKLLKTALDEASADIEALATMTGPYAAYAAYASDKEKDGREYKAYPLYWREDHARQRIIFYGLDPDEIGNRAQWLEGPGELHQH